MRFRIIGSSLAYDAVAEEYGVFRAIDHESDRFLSEAQTMIMLRPTSGFSLEAELLSQAANSVRDRQRATRTFGRQDALSELAEIWSECNQPNWDGHGAMPVSAETLHQTYCLLETLPPNVPVPSIGAEPDGQLTLEWHRSRRRTLSVSVTPDGELHYAALLGPNREYGTEAHFGELPTRIIELIQRLFRI